MMIPPSELAFDIDGVFADTMSLFIDIARSDFGITGLKYEDITEYDLCTLAGIDAGIYIDIIMCILEGRHSGTLKEIEGASDVLKRVNQRHCPTLFVTARPNADQVYGWILDTLCLEPEKIDIVATGSFEDKQQALLKNGIKYFVEDRLETCFTLSDAGIQPIVFKQPWNRKPHPFCEVANWQELESLISFD
ncbi:MAG: haloacid dehalogenase [Desulfobacteraceae bacterium]|nr:MAG: haloacid dehalogenase [Desulfobacteraceae bacterium]